MFYDRNILWYDIDAGVESFTAAKNAVLPYEVVTGHQVHGVRIARISEYGLKREDLEGYDALITDLPDCPIGVRTADCIPILMYDKAHNAVAAVHSGWRGTVGKIAKSTIMEMSGCFGTDASDINAVIGPGICSGSFQVGEEVVGVFRESGFPMDIIWEWKGKPVPGTMDGGHHIDLIKANIWLLQTAGVPAGNIMTSDICTYLDSAFYSARREGASCGRNISSIKITGVNPK